MSMFNWSTQTGISVTDADMTLVELKNNQVVHQATQSIQESLETAARALREQSSAKTKSCIVNLPTSWCHFARIQFPKGMDAKLMKAALPEQLEKALPLPLEELFYDHQVSVGKSVIFFVGVEKRRIEALDFALSAAGWKKIQYVHDGIALQQAHNHPVCQGCAVSVYPLKNKVFINLTENGYVLDSIVIEDLPAGLNHMFKEADSYFHEKVEHVVLPEHLSDAVNIDGVELHKVPVKNSNDVVEQIIFAKGASMSSGLFTSDDRLHFLSLLK